MGCKKSKEAEEACEHAQEEIGQTTWEEDKKQESAPLKEECLKRNGIRMDSGLVLAILEMMGASKEQQSFWMVWAKHVHDQALPIVVEGTGQQLFISTDLRFLEVRLTAPSIQLKKLLGNFVDGIKGLPRRLFDELDMVLNCLQGNMASPQITVWCKFKHCRSDAPPPSVDCGYILNQDLQWSVIDVMMPCHEDEDALREFALSEKHHPILYGSSLLPEEPEKQLGFELHESASQNSRQILLTAFFFFKALGLMKPEDRIVRILNSCQSEQLVVCAGLGPDGLVRLALSLISPRSTTAAKEMADELAFQYREKDLNAIIELMNGEPDVIEYVGETKGYGIRLGFTA